MKEYTIQEIKNVPPPAGDAIPGITTPKLNYGTAVGGKNAPADGATKNTGALANLDAVGADQILALAITNAKIAVDAIQGAVIAAGAITENKLYTGAVTTDKIYANAITTAKIAANAITASKIAADTITAKEIYSGYVYAGTIYASQITAGTLTGFKVQTSASDNAGVKIGTVGLDSGIFIYGQTLQIRDTGGTLKGYIGANSEGAYLIGVTGWNTRIGSYSDIVLDAALNAGVRPARVGVNLGASDYVWERVFANKYNIGNNVGYSLSISGTTLVANGFTKFSVNGYSFKEVGFTFKDGSGNNKYLIVLATADPA